MRYDDDLFLTAEVGISYPHPRPTSSNPRSLLLQQRFRKDISVVAVEKLMHKKSEIVLPLPQNFCNVLELPTVAFDPFLGNLSNGVFNYCSWHF